MRALRFYGLRLLCSEEDWKTTDQSAETRSFTEFRELLDIQVASRGAENLWNLRSRPSVVTRHNSPRKTRFTVSLHW